MGTFHPRQDRRKVVHVLDGNCTADPWIQNGTCSRFGEYVPDDLKAAFPDLGARPFPLTAGRISPALKQQLIKQYQAANTPVSSKQIAENKMIQSQTITPSQALTEQPQQSQMITQSQRTRAMMVQPQAALPKPDTGVSALARSGIFARGVEEKEGRAAGQEGNGTQTESVETSDPAVIEDGTPEIVEPVALKLDRPFHSTDAKGEPVELKTGAYEVGPIMDLQLGLAKEGQSTVLLNAKQDRHSFPIHRTLALVIPGPSDDMHLLYLTADGRRFEAIGFPSAVTPRSIDTIAPLPDKTIEAAVRAASVSPRGVSSPPCRPNPNEIGPRWVPVPCTVTDP
jgi:hypothetical protein